MRREWSGRSGEIVGSAGYFAALNREHFIGGMMLRPDGWAYHETLRETAERARDTAEQVWGDLRRHAAALQDIPKEDRAALAAVMEGLAAVCALGSVSSGRCGDCVALLNRWDSPVRTKSAADGRDVPEDVWQKLRCADDPRQFSGRCGYAIGSEAYITYVEERVFLGELPREVGGRRGSRAYRRLLENSLEVIARAVERDLEQGRYDDCVIGEKAETLRRAVKELARCGARCYSLKEK